jgi:cellulose synthase/poly-beta-1,6-N-acetylglucosamine synthase-like glycosyltransferase
LGVVPFLEGGLMVLRRESIDRAGGIETISGAIGDDTRLGRLLRRAGYELQLAPFVIVHRSEAQSTRNFISCYRRWLACHRTEATSGFWAELLLNPTAAPLLFATVAGRTGWVIVAASLLLRTMTTVFIDRALLRRHGVSLGWWTCLRPLADLLHFSLCVSVVVHPWVTWRGIRYAVGLRDATRAGDDLRDRPKGDAATAETEAA